MVKNGSLNVRVSPKIKMEAEKIYSDFGITLSDAVNMFLNKSVMVGGLPFDLIQPKYNKETETAIEEGLNEFRSGKLKRYANVEDA